jgi:hypothetical protein
MQKRLAVRRQFGLTFHTVKEALAEFIFQLLNLLAQ